MISQTLALLNKKYSVYFLYFAKNEIACSENKLGVTKCELLPFPRLYEIVYRLFIRKSRSLQEHLFYSIKAKKIIDNYLSNISPNLVIADMIRCGQYVEDCLQVPRILEMDDLLSLRYRRFIKHIDYEVDLLGTFNYLLPAAIRKPINFLLKKYLLKKEARILALREIEATRHFDYVTLVSGDEANKLREKSGVNNIKAIPPSFDNIQNVYNPPSTLKLLFIGNLLTNQNLSSLSFIVNKVLPFIDKRGINYTLNVIGAFDERAIKIAQTNKCVELKGFVEDLEMEMSEATALMSPIVFGSGIKIKILDAMTHGLPVITNAVGAEGIPIVSQKNCILAEDPDAIAEAAIKIFFDRDFAFSISQESVNTLVNHFSRSKIEADYINITETAMSK